jgi:hypothetical protein
VIFESSAFLFPLLLSLCVLTGVFIVTAGICNAEEGDLVSEGEEGGGRKGDVSGVGEVIDNEGGIWSDAGDDDPGPRGGVDGSPLVFSGVDMVRSDSFAGILLSTSSTTSPELLLMKRPW